MLFRSPFTITATDSGGNTGSRAYTLAVQTVMALGPATLPAATNGTAYSATVVATGGTGTGYTYAVSSGSLPPGLTLDPATGVISGTPTSAGSYPFTITATDSGGNTGSRAYTLAVQTVMAVGPATLPAATNGTAYSATVVATGGTEIGRAHV